MCIYIYILNETYTKFYKCRKYISLDVQHALRSRKSYNMMSGVI